MAELTENRLDVHVVNCGSKQPCITCGPDPSMERGTFEGGHVSPLLSMEICDVYVACLEECTF